jgi:Tol biopolymer transport system component
MPKNISIDSILTIIVILILTTISLGEITGVQTSHVPHQERWGIYQLDILTQNIELIYTSPCKISGLQINNTGDTFVFSQFIDGTQNKHQEICTLSVDGTDFSRLTTNSIMDTYPVWSPDGEKIAFLSMGKTLDIYTMSSNGSNVEMLYDSGGHDGDIHWVDNTIAFTRDSQIWVINDDGTHARQITNPEHAGKWGKAVLPFGDYDPRISPDGSTIVFERLVDDATQHGNYNIYSIKMDGTQETALTDTGYTQGLAKWSFSGDKIVYLVTAKGEEGVYDIYMMNKDGRESVNITPGYFPASFLCHSPIFSAEDSKIFFMGEWWEKESGVSGILVISGMVLLVMYTRKKLS